MASTRCPRQLSRLPIDSVLPLSRSYRPIGAVSHLQAKAAPSTACTANIDCRQQTRSFSISSSNSSKPSFAYRRSAKRPHKDKPKITKDQKEAKARLILSNVNALAVPGLPELNAENIANAEALQGQVASFPGEVVDSLRAVGAFKKNQGWGLFRRPSALMRKETVDLAKLMIEAEGKDGSSGVERRVFTGPKRSGKSTLLLQAMAMAFARGWVVISFPEARNLTDARTDYGPIPGTDPVQYFQKAYAADLLGRIASSNSAVLRELTLTQPHPAVTIPLAENMSLERLAVLGSRDTDIAWPVFQALWTELTAPKSTEKKPVAPRPKIMLTLDNLGHAMQDSAYITPPPAMTPIHALDIAFVRFFVDHLAGTTSPAPGGLILGATSASDIPANKPTFDFAMKAGAAAYVASMSSSERAALPPPETAGLDALPEERPHWNPYIKADGRVLEALKDVPVRPLGGLSRDEARAVLDYYAASGMFKAEVSEAVVGERWTVAGGGIVGDLERGVVGF